MRICLDARKLWDSGIGTYIRGLLQGFDAISPELSWDFIIRPEDQFSRLLDETRGEMIISRAPNYSLRELTSVSAIANRRGSSLFHAPHYTVPFGLRMPLVVTIHDLIHLRFPQYFSRVQRAYARWMLRRATRESARILTVSQNTKRDLIEMLRADESKIHVIHNGINRTFFQPVSADQVQHFRRRFGLPESYLLCVGNLKSHKNVGGLMRIWAKLTDSIRPPLIIVGAKRDQYADLLRLANELNRVEEIFFPGEIPPADLRCAYQGAAALVQPSWYEGFGFPPLEAMACGTPTAVSNRGSLPEVAGDAALIFDPADSDQFTAALERILTDGALRQGLITKGKVRAGQFKWESCAQATLGVYREVIQSDNGN